MEPGKVRELYEYYDTQTTATEHAGESDGDELRVQRTEKELKAGTREREAGDARVRKSVRTDRERAEVPTEREGL